MALLHLDEFVLVPFQVSLLLGLFLVVDFEDVVRDVPYVVHFRKTKRLEDPSYRSRRVDIFPGDVSLTYSLDNKKNYIIIDRTDSFLNNNTN